MTMPGFRDWRTIKRSQDFLFADFSLSPLTLITANLPPRQPHGLSPHNDMAKLMFLSLLLMMLHTRRRLSALLGDIEAAP